MIVYDYVKKIEDLCTAVSVILFGVENVILVFAKNTEEKIEAGIMLGMLSVLCVGLFAWTFFKKKNRDYNVYQMYYVMIAEYL